VTVYWLIFVQFINDKQKRETSTDVACVLLLQLTYAHQTQICMRNKRKLFIRLKHLKIVTSLPSMSGLKSDCISQISLHWGELAIIVVHEAQFIQSVWRNGGPTAVFDRKQALNRH